MNAIYFSNTTNLDESELISPINNFNIIFSYLGETNDSKKDHKFFILNERDKRMAFSQN